MTPWTEYLLGTLVVAYREFEGRVGLLTAARGAKTEMVLQTIEHLIGDFSVAQVQELSPTVGIDLIRRILREQKNLGKLECLGRGPLARWRRI